MKGIYKTYRTANFRGRKDSTGKRKKQRTKQAAAPRLQHANTSRRSHRLTVVAPRSEGLDQQTVPFASANFVHSANVHGSGSDHFAISRAPTLQPTITIITVYTISTIYPPYFPTLPPTIVEIKVKLMKAKLTC